MAKSYVTTIIHRHQRYALRCTKLAVRPLKLDARARRCLIRHVERFPHDSFAALATPSKTSHTPCRTTTRNYLKAGYFRYKARRNPYWFSKHKLAWLKWAKDHVNWTLEDWLHVILTVEATFEMGLDICIYERTSFKVTEFIQHLPTVLPIRPLTPQDLSITCTLRLSTTKPSTSLLPCSKAMYNTMTTTILTTMSLDPQIVNIEKADLSFTHHSLLR